MTTNMGKAHRTFYAVSGVVTIGVALFARLGQPWPLVLAGLGALALIESAAGF